MKSKEICEMCMEYDEDKKCENKKNCKLQKLLKDNKNKELRGEVSFAGWDASPDMMGK